MINFNWFDTLTKPLFSPPAWLFSPTWIFLYTTILVSLIIYTTTRTYHDKKKGYIFFIVQLLLNIAWTPAFFVLKNIGLALVIIILLDIFVFLTIKSFAKISKTSAWILVPYFIWILFATYLNAGFLVLN